MIALAIIVILIRCAEHHARDDRIVDYLPDKPQFVAGVGRKNVNEM